MYKNLNTTSEVLIKYVNLKINALFHSYVVWHIVYGGVILVAGAGDHVFHSLFSMTHP